MFLARARPSLSLPPGLASYGRLAALKPQEDIGQQKGCALGKKFQRVWEERGGAVGFHPLEGTGVGGSILPRVLGNLV